MTIQDMAAALAARDAGMASSAEHAEQTWPGWQEQALEWLVGWCKGSSTNTPFTMEDFRRYCAARDMPQPPELRAYGALTVRAIREGIIEKTGSFAPAASSHGSHKPLYRAKGRV